MKKYLPLILLDTLAIINIALTVWIGNYGSWTTLNLSVIGYWYGYSRRLIWWGWLTGAVFMAYLFYLQRLFKPRSRISVIFTFLAGTFLIVGVYLPYQPEPHPILSNIHIAFSFLAPVCVAAAVISLVAVLVSEKVPFVWIFYVVLLVLIAVAAVIFIKCTIISTLLEVYTITALTVYMTALALVGLKRKRSNACKDNHC